MSDVVAYFESVCVTCLSCLMSIGFVCPFDMRGGFLFAEPPVQEVRACWCSVSSVASCECDFARNFVVMCLTWWHILTLYA